MQKSFFLFLFFSFVVRALFSFLACVVEKKGQKSFFLREERSETQVFYYYERDLFNFYAFLWREA